MGISGTITITNTYIPGEEIPGGDGSTTGDDDNNYGSGDGSLNVGDLEKKFDLTTDEDNDNIPDWIIPGGNIPGMAGVTPSPPELKDPQQDLTVREEEKLNVTFKELEKDTVLIATVEGNKGTAKVRENEKNIVEYTPPENVQTMMLVLLNVKTQKRAFSSEIVNFNMLVQPKKPATPTIREGQELRVQIRNKRYIFLENIDSDTTVTAAMTRNSQGILMLRNGTNNIIEYTAPNTIEIITPPGSKPENTRQIEVSVEVKAMKHAQISDPLTFNITVTLDRVPS